MGTQTGLREQSKAETRLAIQLAAVELFEQNGYDATTVDDIARRAAVAPRTFFRYFPSKELTLFSKDIAPRLASLVTDAPAELAPFAALRWAVDELTDFESTPLDLRRQALRRRFSSTPAIEKHLAHLHDTLGTRLLDAVRNRMGIAADQDTDMRAEVVVAVYFGLARELAKEARPIHETIDRWFRSVESMQSLFSGPA